MTPPPGSFEPSNVGMTRGPEPRPRLTASRWSRDAPPSAHRGQAVRLRRLDVVRALFRRPFQTARVHPAGLVHRLASRSCPTALVAIPFGAVIALQVGSLIRQLGAQSFTGAAAVLAVIREAAPIVTALLIAGAGGSAICADLGARKIREEIDAMEVLGIDPIQRLVVPRVLAAHAASRSSSTAWSASSASAGGYFFNVDPAGRHPGRLPRLLHRAGPAARPLASAMIKALIFGLIAAIVASYKGLNAGGGPKGVGRRGQRVRGHHVHAAVRRQLRASARSTSRSSRRRSEPEQTMSQRQSALQRAARGPRQPRRPAARSTCASLAWTPRTLRRYQKEILRLLAEVTFGSGALAVIGGTVGVIAVPDLLHRHRGRPAGLRRAQPDRHRRLHRLRLGLLQHPRDRAAGRRHRAGRHGRLRLHRPARRDADLRGDRRPRGDGRSRRCRSS